MRRMIGFIGLLFAFALSASGQDAQEIQKRIYGSFGGGVKGKAANTAAKVGGYVVRKGAQQKIKEQDRRNTAKIQDLIAQKPLAGIRVCVEEDPANRNYYSSSHTLVPPKRILLEMGALIPRSQIVQFQFGDLGACRTVLADFAVLIGQPHLVTQDADEAHDGGSINIPIGRGQWIDYRGGERVETQYVSVPVEVVAFEKSGELSIGVAESDGRVRGGNTYYGISTNGYVGISRSGGSSSRTDAEYVGYAIAVQNSIADAVGFILQRKSELGK